jgi:hypothetical protein
MKIEREREREKNKCVSKSPENGMNTKTSCYIKLRQ